MRSAYPRPLDPHTNSNQRVVIFESEYTLGELGTALEVLKSLEAASCYSKEHATDQVEETIDLIAEKSINLTAHLIRTYMP